MLKRFIKYFILILIFNLNGNIIEAKKVPGFIITENSDTIYGQIKLSKFNLLTGTWFLRGINLEQLHFEIWFKENKSRKFKNFKAIDISGFGFNYKSSDFYFQSFTLESNTRIINERKRDRFLQLIYKGQVELYKDLIRVINYDNINDYSTIRFKNRSFLYYDFFLYNKTKGLTKVELTKDKKTINQLLNLYDFDKEYLKRIPNNTKFKDIKLILIDYDLWFYLKNREKRKYDNIKTFACYK